MNGCVWRVHPCKDRASSQPSSESLCHSDEQYRAILMAQRIQECVPGLNIFCVQLGSHGVLWPECPPCMCLCAWQEGYGMSHEDLDGQSSSQKRRCRCEKKRNWEEDCYCQNANIQTDDAVPEAPENEPEEHEYTTITDIFEEEKTLRHHTGATDYMDTIQMSVTRFPEDGSRPVVERKETKKTVSVNKFGEVVSTQNEETLLYAQDFNYSTESIHQKPQIEQRSESEDAPSELRSGSSVPKRSTPHQRLSSGNPPSSSLSSLDIGNIPEVLVANTKNRRTEDSRRTSDNAAISYSREVLVTNTKNRRTEDSRGTSDNAAISYSREVLVANTKNRRTEDSRRTSDNAAISKNPEVLIASTKIRRTEDSRGISGNAAIANNPEVPVANNKNGRTEDGRRTSDNEVKGLVSRKPRSISEFESISNRRQFGSEPGVVIRKQTIELDETIPIAPGFSRTTDDILKEISKANSIQNLDFESNIASAVASARMSPNNGSPTDPTDNELDDVSLLSMMNINTIHRLEKEEKVADSGGQGKVLDVHEVRTNERRVKPPKPKTPEPEPEPEPEPKKNAGPKPKSKNKYPTGSTIEHMVKKGYERACACNCNCCNNCCYPCDYYCGGCCYNGCYNGCGYGCANPSCP